MSDAGAEPIILGLESSCDETAVALLQGRTVLGQFVASQIDLHRKWGGVVPEVACRAHMEALLPALAGMLEESGVAPERIAAVAVTNRPGLIGALLVGVSAAKALCLAWDKPLIGVNHIEAHITACKLDQPELAYPFIALVVSGGHTNVFLVRGGDDYLCLHGTLDDAAGEAFDKVAKILELGFPGGPAIEKAARGGNPKAYPWKRACLPDGERDFSFSGIKTAVLYAARGQERGRSGLLRLDAQGVSDAAASFQRAAVFALAERTASAARRHGVKWIAVGGGVAANSALRVALAEAAEAAGCRFAAPPLRLCTDNAVMVAARGAELFAAGRFAGMELEALARGA